jgi:hypothetical protein
MPYGPGDRNRTQALVADLGHAHALAEHAQRIEHYIRTFRSDA